MNYYFAEVKDGKVFSLHDSTSLDLVFRNSDGLLVDLTEYEYWMLSACRGDIAKGISSLREIKAKIDAKVTENL